MLSMYSLLHHDTMYTSTCASSHMCYPLDTGPSSYQDMRYYATHHTLWGNGGATYPVGTLSRVSLGIPPDMLPPKECIYVYMVTPSTTEDVWYDVYTLP